MQSGNLKLAEHDICYVIFGASGDLAVRMLIPSLQTISCYNSFSKNSKIIGVARTEYEKGDIEDKLEKGIHQFSRLNPSLNEAYEEADVFLERFKYINGQYDDPEMYKNLKNEIESNDGIKFEGILIYMATPPNVVDVVAKGVYDCGIRQTKKRWVRMICEKPFGYNLKTAIELNEKLHNYFNEDQIYRIDHYLAKETVTNIFTFRWGNAIWEPLWNRNYVSHVEITVAETVGCESRVGYYEQSSVIRDMIQNHLLQVLTIIAMDPPTKMTADAIRDEKMKVLNAIRPFLYEDSILGQYEGYKDHKGVKKDTTTPTFAFIRLYIDNWRWQGVPFFICSGKCMNKKESTVKIVFKRVPHSIFGEDTISRPNTLELKLQPNEGIILHQHVKQPGQGLCTSNIPIQFFYADEFGPNSIQGAYERVILDAVQGDQSFFTRADEIEQSWRIVSPLLTETNFVVPYALGIDVSCNSREQIHTHKNYFPNITELVNGTCELITNTISDCISANGVCRIALSGGRTFRPIYASLATSMYISRINLKKLKIFFTAEKDVESSNYSMINETFLSLTDIPKENVFRIKSELKPEEAAKEYQEVILNEFKDDSNSAEPSFDLILLGLDEDGSTAGLFPGLPSIHDKESYVLSSTVNRANANKITFGLRLLNASKNVMFIVDDKRKDEAVRLVTHAPYCPAILPAQVVRPTNGNLSWNRLV